MLCDVQVPGWVTEVHQEPSPQGPQPAGWARPASWWAGHYQRKMEVHHQQHGIQYQGHCTWVKPPKFVETTVDRTLLKPERNPPSPSFYCVLPVPDVSGYSVSPDGRNNTSLTCCATASEIFMTGMQHCVCTLVHIDMKKIKQCM